MSPQVTLDETAARPRPGDRSIFADPGALPRGPHWLTREQVATSQRTRLMAAVVDVVAERGYAAATIAAITRRAGVSPKTFYEHFKDKLDCFLASYEVFVETLMGRMAAEVAPDASWHDFISSTLAAYLLTLEDNPAVARAFLIEMHGAGPVARRRRREAYGQLAAVIKERHEAIRERDPTLGALPDGVYLGITHGVREVVCDALEERPRPRLIDLAPDMLLWITAMVDGAARASLELSQTEALLGGIAVSPRKTSAPAAPGTRPSPRQSPRSPATPPAPAPRPRGRRQGQRPG
jgi:AcrR family transcriptional regulator